MMLCTGLATAQQVFSLDDCIKYTLENHDLVKVYDNNTAIAKAQSAQAVGAYLPTINGSGTMVNNLQLQTTVLPAGIFGPTPVEVQFGTKYTTNCSVDVNQSIYDRSKIVAIQANKPHQELTELQKQQNKETLMYNTSRAYFQVLIYKEQLHLLEANKYKYDEMLKVLEYQHSKGTVLEKDVDRVRVNLNTTNYQIEDAHNKEALAINTLKNAMGLAAAAPFAIANGFNYENLATVPVPQQPDLNTLVETKINALSVTMQEFNVKVQKAAFMPSLSAVGKWGSQSLNNDFSQVFSNWNGYSYVGLSLNVPVFSGFRRKNAVTEEKLKLKNEELNFNLNKQSLQLVYDNAQSTVTASFNSYKTNIDNLALAKKVLEVTDYQYQRGVASLTDYLNDDTAYKAAQTNYISSLYNLMISQLAYQKSKGTLPDFLSTIK